ncbi:Acetyl-coenzyme A synthetase [Microbacterium oxydans]|nr:Acetyl-coenzyme A synthetase [Microbacterium oxydans]
MLPIVRETCRGLLTGPGIGTDDENDNVAPLRSTPTNRSLTRTLTTTGQAVVAFVIIKESYLAAHEPAGLAQQLRLWVGEQIGAIARPRDVYIVGELPKTRSGKIMRRLLRDVAEGREVGDTTTLADTAVMSIISAQVK